GDEFGNLQGQTVRERGLVLFVVHRKPNLVGRQGTVGQVGDRQVVDNRHAAAIGRGSESFLRRFALRAFARLQLRLKRLQSIAPRSQTSCVSDLIPLLVRMEIDA